jgi:DNA-binding transcriptional ArsR family regulator
MAKRDPGTTLKLTDPRALRAVAHPTRLALVGLLRRESPLTATQAGEAIGESAASASFHLRQLAKWGLVEEAGGGRGRERPWRATAQFTEWPGSTHDPELSAATELLSAVVAERYFESLMRWLELRSDAPPDWQDAAPLGDTLLYLTPEELTEISEGVRALLEPYLERTPNRDLRPEGSRLVSFLHLAFPTDEGLSESAGARSG